MEKWLAVVAAATSIAIFALAAVLMPSEALVNPTPAFSKVMTGGGIQTAKNFNDMMMMRYPYAQISDLTTQNCLANGAVSNVLLNTNDSIYRMTHSTSSNTHQIIIQDTGIYLVIAAPQIGEATVQADGIHNFWIVKNGVKIANSNIKMTVMQQISGSETMVNVLQWVGKLESGDTISFAQSCTDSDIGIIFTPSNSVEPATPSIIVSVARVN